LWNFLEGNAMRHRRLCVCALAIVLPALAAENAAAQETIKIGMIGPLTGGLAANGREMSGGAKVYMAQHGNKVAGKTIELIIRDDYSVPENARRMAQATDAPANNCDRGLTCDRHLSAPPKGDVNDQSPMGG
jgi:hypothetical protein